MLFFSHFSFREYLMPDFYSFPVNLHFMSENAQLSFSRLLDPDWSIQISGTLGVCAGREIPAGYKSGILI